MAAQFTIIDLSEVEILDNNPRKIDPSDLEKLCRDIESDPEFLTQRPPLINRIDGKLICYAGQQRITALKKLGRTESPAFVEDNVSKEIQDRRMILDNTHRGKWDIDILLNEYKIGIDSLIDLGVPDIEFKFDEVSESSDIERQEAKQSLRERFLVPPFSILDTRQGYWQDRKKVWHKLFDSQETREDVELIAKSGQSTHIYELRNRMREQLKREPEWDEIINKAKQLGLHVYEGASVFDPVLCEVLYTWFCPKNAIILDPFAGGSVRGIVASMLGHEYHGIDLRIEQVEANRKQLESLKDLEPAPIWHDGDSSKVLNDLNCSADFVFSCPPYHDLEKYSDDPADLSNMDYPQFNQVYMDIIHKAVSKLKPNRFACFVVAEIRDKDGFYQNFVQDTIRHFEAAGCFFYNEIILVNVSGSLAIRAGRQFTSGRKVGKQHQNVLVFYKGDPKEIRNEFPEVTVAEIENADE